MQDSEYSKTKKTKLTFWHLVAVWIWVGWISFYVSLLIALVFIGLFWSIKICLAIISVLALAMIPTVDPLKQPQWGYDFGEWIISKGLDYFQIRTFFEDKEAVEKSGQALFTLEPHGILPMSIIAFHPLHFKAKTKLSSGMTNACFMIPFMRHIYTWVRAESVDKTNLLKRIKSGYSPVFCPGGVQEVAFMGNKKEVVLFLKSRYGFIKLALQHGLELVPVFAFGLDDLFDYTIPKNGIFKYLGRKLGFLPLYFSGLWGVPFGPAKPNPITVVIGKPIKVTKVAEPTAEDIAKLQEVYLAGMTRLYETYKDKFGFGDVVLRIV